MKCEDEQQGKATADEATEVNATTDEAAADEAAQMAAGENEVYKAAVAAEGVAQLYDG